MTKNEDTRSGAQAERAPVDKRATQQSTTTIALELLIESDPEPDPWTSLADALALDGLRREGASS